VDTLNLAPGQQEEIPWNYKNYGTVLDQSDDLYNKKAINTQEEAHTSFPVSEWDYPLVWCVGGKAEEHAGTVSWN